FAPLSFHPVTFTPATTGKYLLAGAAIAEKTQIPQKAKSTGRGRQGSGRTTDGTYTISCAVSS
ncbi:hypothetical protein, partial [Klebsiella pneumoniae]|uniref:hypothetical protein n=1 Tax=Klebsiella pneumoniae TaxID=573 RepID=UPI001C6FADA9